MSNQLTKLRILMERAERRRSIAKRRLDEDIATARAAFSPYDKSYMDALEAYRDEAERCGLCRICFKPMADGGHDGVDHVAIAGGEVLVEYTDGFVSVRGPALPDCGAKWVFTNGVWDAREEFLKAAGIDHAQA